MAEAEQGEHKDREQQNKRTDQKALRKRKAKRFAVVRTSVVEHLLLDPVQVRMHQRVDDRRVGRVLSGQTATENADNEKLIFARVVQRAA